MPCVPTEAVTVLGAVEVLVVMVDVSCDFAGRVEACAASPCRVVAEIERIYNQFCGAGYSTIEFTRKSF